MRAINYTIQLRAARLDHGRCWVSHTWPDILSPTSNLLQSHAAFCCQSGDPISSLVIPGERAMAKEVNNGKAQSLGGSQPPSSACPFPSFPSPRGGSDHLSNLRIPKGGQNRPCCLSSLSIEVTLGALACFHSPMFFYKRLI